jgi:hypothetical protein
MTVGLFVTRQNHPINYRPILCIERRVGCEKGEQS